MDHQQQLVVELDLMPQLMMILTHIQNNSLLSSRYSIDASVASRHLLPKGRGFISCHSLPLLLSSSAKAGDPENVASFPGSPIKSGMTAGRRCREAADEGPSDKTPSLRESFVHIIALDSSNAD